MHVYRRLSAFVAVLLLVSLVGCGFFANDPLEAALQSISTERLGDYIETLASDDFEGRAPNSPGEEMTVAFLTEHFREIGLEPGNGESYEQEVPLVSITADEVSPLQVEGASYAYGDDYMAWTRRIVDDIALDGSEMVFVGYGIVAPEYDWNDYEGLDIEGKTVVMLVNDPGFATEDTTLFKGREMTYYGRWTYKYDEAARQGAEAVFIVHETEPAGYPWEVVSGSWSGPQFDLDREEGSTELAAVEGWLHHDTALDLFQQAGHDYEALKEEAVQPDFEPVPLEQTASLEIQNEISRSTSRNVIARLPGTERADEAVIYTAHWDHLGRDTTLEGDQIYNGAEDNATGTAALLELAEAFTEVEPQRSVYFLAVTAEEQGLLGSAYYAENPVVPLEKTAAVINMDVLNVYGPMRDITVVGYGQSELEDYLERAAREENRVLRPDPEPEKGFYFRSDHFSFAQKGVPALYTDTGVESIEHGEEWMLQQREQYTEERYHKPADEYDSSWNLEGMVEDLRLLFQVGHALADTSGFPGWKEGSAFKSVREEAMGEE